MASLYKGPVSRGALALLIACAGSGAAIGRARPAHAQDEDPATVGAARALAVAGVKLAQAGHCDSAIDKLERAERLHHAPVVVEQLAECYVELGRLVEGTELLRALLREPIPAHPGKALLAAYVRAQRVLDATKPKIATVTLTVSGVDPERATVAVDGQPLPGALLGVPRPTDPGEHVIAATARGFATIEQHVTLAPGEGREIVLQLAAESQVATDTPHTANPAREKGAGKVPGLHPRQHAASLAGAPARVAQQPTSGAGNRVLAYASWGAAAIAIGIGAGFGVAALDHKSDLDARCPRDVCPTSERERLDDAQRYGVISTIGFGVGAGLAVVGGILFFTASDREVDADRKAHGASAGGSEKMAAQLRVGLGRADVAVAF